MLALKLGTNSWEVEVSKAGAFQELHRLGDAPLVDEAHRFLKQRLVPDHGAIRLERTLNIAPPVGHERAILARVPEREAPRHRVLPASTSPLATVEAQEKLVANELPFESALNGKLVPRLHRSVAVMQ